jgi:hypothetical protein
MNIQPRRLVGSVLAAVALMLCLGLGMFAVMMATRGGNAIKAEKSGAEQQNVDCQFTAASERLIVYQAPIQALSQQKAAVLGGETYPIIKQNMGYYLLQLAEGDSGWANSQDGTTVGDCKNIPIDGTSLAGFPSLCLFTNSQEVTLYSKPDLINAIGTAPPGTYLIESTTGSQYYVALDENYSGWVAVADGQTAGDCGSLPVAPG